MNALVPALVAGAAAALLVGADPGRRLGHVTPVVRSHRRWTRGSALASGAVGVSLFAVIVLGLSTGLLVCAVAVAGAVMAQLLLARHDLVLRSGRRRAVSRAARVLAGQLRLGQVPTVALSSAASDCPPLERAAATLAIGGDVSAALREVGREPGHEGLVTLAMAWELSERSGAPIAALSRQVSDGLRVQDESRAQVAAELAGPRASGRLLATLPLIGLAMGRFAGGDPFHFLTGSLAGHLCILAAVVLAGVGVLWTERLADVAQG